MLTKARRNRIAIYESGLLFCAENVARRWIRDHDARAPDDACRCKMTAGAEGRARVGPGFLLLLLVSSLVGSGVHSVVLMETIGHRELGRAQITSVKER